MKTYTELRQRADEHWQGLVAGERPWIRVGTAMCGHAAGAAEVLDAIRNELEARGVEANVDEVGCLGLCFAEPLVDILKPGGSRLFFGNVTPGDVPALIDGYLLSGGVRGPEPLGYLGDTPMDSVPDLNELPGMRLQERIALRNAGTIAPADVLQYVANGGYAGLNKALFEMDPQGVIKEVTDSGLRGRGGAAFPTGVKWGFLVRSPGPPKYILCNCEEGDPGAYNDKGILESDPYTLLEGMTIAGYADGLLQRLRLHKARPRRADRPDGEGHRAGVRGRASREEHPRLRLLLRHRGVAHGRVLRRGRGDGSDGVDRGQPVYAAVAPALPRRGGGVGQAEQHQQRQEPVVRAGDNLPRERVVLLVWRQPQHGDRDHLPERRHTPPGALRGADGRYARRSSRRSVGASRRAGR